MSKKRYFAAFGAAGLVFAGVFGAAATLNVDGGVLQSGTDSDLTCDPNGVAVTGWGLETDTNSVTSAKVEGIEGACFGRALFANVLSENGTQIASGRVDTIDNTTESVTFGSVTPEQIGRIRLTVE